MKTHNTFSSFSIIIIISILLNPTLTFSQSFESKFSPGSIGGNFGGAAVKGNYSFITIGLNLITLENTDKVFTVVSKTPINLAPSYLYVSGDYLYLFNESKGLDIYDVSNPLSPTKAGTYSMTNYSTEQFVISGNYAYLPFSDYGFKILDISNPASPKQVFTSSTIKAKRVFVLGNYCYIIDNSKNANLLIYDISDPADPQELSVLRVDWGNGIYAAGSRVYIAGSTSGFITVDVSNPAKPQKITYPQGNWAGLDIIAEGNLLYCIDQPRGLDPSVLHIINIQDVNNPVELATLSYNEGIFRKILLNGNKLYFINDLSVDAYLEVDVSNPTTPRITKKYTTPVIINSFHISGREMYAGSFNKICRYNIEDPENVVLEKIYSNIRGGRLKLYRNLMITIKGDTLFINDMSDYNNPAVLSFVQLPKIWGNYAYEIRGNYIYIYELTPEPHIRIIDISNPAVPVQKYLLNLASAKTGRFIKAPEQSDYIIVGYDKTSGNPETVFIDVSNAEKPVITKTYETSGSPVDYFQLSKTAFLAYNVTAQNKWFIEAIDISDIANPVKLDEISGDNTLNSIFSGGNIIVALSPVEGAIYLSYDETLSSIKKENGKILEEGLLKEEGKYNSPPDYPVSGQATSNPENPEEQNHWILDAGNFYWNKVNGEGWIERARVTGSEKVIPVLIVDPCISIIKHFCACESEVELLRFNVRNNNVDDWLFKEMDIYVSNIDLLKNQIKELKLRKLSYKDSTSLANGIINADRGKAFFKHIGGDIIKIKKGEELTFSIRAVLKDSICPMDSLIDFNITIQTKDMVFIPDVSTSEYDVKFIDLVNGNIIGDSVTLFCVENVSQKMYYKDITSAVNEDMDKDILEVCPGKYYESKITLNREGLTLKSKKGKQVTRIIGNEIFILLNGSAIIEGFSLQGIGNNSFCLTSLTSDGFIFANNDISSFRIGVNVDGKKQAAMSISRCYFWGNNQNIYIKNAKFLSLSNSSFFQSTADKALSSIEIYSTNEILSYNNIFNMNKLPINAIKVFGIVSFSSTNDTVISSNLNGFSLSDCKSSEIEDLQCIDNKNGLKGDYIGYLSIRSSLFSQNKVAISLYYTKNFDLTKNIFEFNEQMNGFYHQCTILEIANNRFVSNNNRVRNIFHECALIKETENEYIISVPIGGSINKLEKNVILSDENSVIILSNSGSFIYGNQFFVDSASSILCMQNSSPIINKNNFYNKDLIAVDNTDDNILVNARTNYWGDPSGPGGEGPGTGSKVSKYVDFGQFLTEPVALVAAPQNDTLYVPENTTDSVMFFFQNWQKRDDAIKANITEEHDWLLNKGDTTITIPDSLGGFVSSTFTTPSVTTGEISNLVLFYSESLSNSDWKDTARVTIITYNPEINHITVLPDTVELLKNDSTYFIAFASDQHDCFLEDTEFTWQAEGGTIDEYGQYIAGDVLGTYKVIAQDSNSGLKDTAYVVIVDTLTSVKDNYFSKYTQNKDLCKVYPNPFTETTKIQFIVEEYSKVELKIYNPLGQEMAVLVNEYLTEGEYEVKWEPETIESGIYFFSFKAGNFINTGKIVRVR